MAGRKRSRQIILAIVFVSIGWTAYKVGLTLWEMDSRSIRDRPLKLLQRIPQSLLEIKEFHRAKVEGGRKVWELSGSEARFSKAEAEAVVTRPRFVYYDPSGELFEAFAKEARITFVDEEVAKMQLVGGISVSYQGFSLEADEIFYLGGKNEIFLPGRVKLKGDGFDLEGEGMEIILAEEKIRFLRNVKSRIAPGGPGFSRIGGRARPRS
jgi:LPS export ABC transporter protein LptC